MYRRADLSTSCAGDERKEIPMPQNQKAGSRQRLLPHHIWLEDPSSYRPILLPSSRAALLLGETDVHIRKSGFLRILATLELGGSKSRETPPNGIQAPASPLASSLAIGLLLDLSVFLFPPRSKDVHCM